MDESTMNLPPYALAEISIGDEILNARPIEWDREIADGEGKDENGDYAVAIKYETACPGCGDSLIFEAGMSSVRCPHCGIGEDEHTEVYESPFQDPGDYAQSITAPDADEMTNKEIARAVEDAINEGDAHDPAPDVDEYEEYNIESEIDSLMDSKIETSKSDIELEEEIGKDS